MCEHNCAPNFFDGVVLVRAQVKGIDAQCYLFAVGDEAAPSTLKGCAMGRISERRCAFQRRYPLGGN